MLEMLDVADQEFLDIVALAKEHISSIDRQWTNTQESDPGITIIELFAWLKMVQLEYMKLISRDSIYKFLELLDIKPKYNKGSSTFLELKGNSNNLFIPRGTKWLADKLVFENLENQNLVKANIVSLEFNNPEVDNEECFSFEEGKIHYIFGEKIKRHLKEIRTFTINFDCEIPKDYKFNIYFDITSEVSKKRNPVKDADEFIEMANISWEYYGIKHGTEGWHEVDTVIDKTHNFLFSDIISFKFSGSMKSINNKYKIRAILKNESYDFPPVLNGIRLNVFLVNQRDTRCAKDILKKREILRNNEIKIYSNECLYGDHLLYVKYKNNWIEANKFFVERNIQEGCTSISFQGLEKFLDLLNLDDDALMVVSYLKDFRKSKTALASGTSISNQTVDFNCKDLLYDNFELMCGKKQEENVVFSFWKKVYSFFSSSKYDQHYVLDWEENKIRFGNHEMAAVPKKGENNIRISQYAVSKGKSSNIKEHMINKVISDNPEINSLFINQFKPAYGGRDNEPFEKLQRKPLNMFSDVKRAVTIKDYETIIKSTPGLIIENIKVLPQYLPGGLPENMNCVTIAIQNGGSNKESHFLESYSKNIKKYFEKYRLINTKIEVTGPSYVGLSIRGEVVINSYQKECKQRVESEINKFIKKLNRELGRLLYFGDLFGTIEQMDCVVYVQNLNIIPSGDYLKQTESDDIIVQPNGAYYIESIDINYLKSTNF